MSGTEIAPSRGSRLFAYGSLEFPEVIGALLGRGLPGAPARLRGYRRGMLAGRPYPGIVEARDEWVDGVVWAGLSEGDIGALDAYEGREYARRTLTVVGPGDEPLESFVYVILPEHRHRIGEAPWERQWFASEHLADYVAHCRQLQRRRATRR
jgi:gamma-glutamylcyclotransferase (GGCT)/AIG2-like uncharacterized protein YtfP